MSDNLLLSDPTLGGDDVSYIADICNVSADVCNSEKIDPEISTLIDYFIMRSSEASTRKAYKSDLAHFQAHGGKLPADSRSVASYLCRCISEFHLSPATLRRRLAAIAWAHRQEGRRDPTKTTLVKDVMRGIERDQGIAQEPAVPIGLSDLKAACKTLGEGRIDFRDKALFLVGYFGAFRGSELVGLNIENVYTNRSELVIELNKSKTDQVGRGTRVQIPSRVDELCPVKALEEWQRSLRRREGPLFPSVNRHGKAGLTPMNTRSLSRVILKRLERAGINTAGISSHSLRAGYITEALKGGMSEVVLAKHTRHSSVDMLKRYYRPQTGKLKPLGAIK
ncbi:MAG: site-specific integrase [Parvibaculum sp.]